MEFSVSAYIRRINWTAQNIIFSVRLTLAKLFAFSWLDFPPMTAKYEKLHIRNNPIDHPRLKQPFISCPLGLLSDTLCPALSFPICGEIFKFKPISFDQPLALLSPSVPITMFIKFGHISMYISPFDEIFEQYSHPGYKRCRWSSSQSLSAVNLDGKL